VDGTAKWNHDSRIARPRADGWKLNVPYFCGVIVLLLNEIEWATRKLLREAHRQSHAAEAGREDDCARACASGNNRYNRPTLQAGTVAHTHLTDAFAFKVGDVENGPYGGE
jgi:hypothetical protein